MIKNILFDFDGVILDSMKIKGDGFIELFKDYPHNSVKILEAYHYDNGGISRFAKIHYFFNEILRTNISEKEIEKLAKRFAQIIAKKLFDKVNLIDETMMFIQHHYQHYCCHIVSGAEDNELQNLCSHLGIAHYFISIEGSPTIKSLLVSNLLGRHNYLPHETLLIGDSLNDYDAASANSISFCGYNNPILRPYGNYLETFIGFNP